LLIEVISVFVACKIADKNQRIRWALFIESIDDDVNVVVRLQTRDYQPVLVLNDTGSAGILANVAA